MSPSGRFRTKIAPHRPDGDIGPHRNLRLSRRLLACGGNDFQLLEKRPQFLGRQTGEHVFLQLGRNPPARGKTTLAERRHLHAVRTAVRLVNLPGNEFRLFHPAQDRRDGVWVRRHQISDFALREPAGIALGEPAQDAKLVRRDPEVRNAPAERLVEPVPRPAEQRRQASRGFRGGFLRGLAGHRGGPISTWTYFQFD